MAGGNIGSTDTGNSSRRSSPGTGASASGAGGGGGGGGGGGSGGVGRRDKLGESSRPLKRRCVSNACIACRRRKSKCDGNTPACAACASVYHTECVYDPNSDHRRKGVYKQDIDNLKTQNTTLHTLVEAILNYPEDRVFDLVKQIRTCDSLEDLVENIVAEQNANVDPEGESPDSAAANEHQQRAEIGENRPISLEAELSGKMGRLRVEDGQVRFIGATSNLLFVTPTSSSAEDEQGEMEGRYSSAIGRSIDIGEKDPITTWTTVTQDPALINHLVRMYFAWHYPYFTTLSKDLFYKEFLRGKNQSRPSGIKYCTSLLVNAILTLGCHFTCVAGSRANHNDPATAGDHFFKEAKRMILENDEHEVPRLTTVQALALMSVREAGCGREARGWVYSGMSFRMAMDLGLHLDPSSLKDGVGLGSGITDEELDARRVTFWGCYLFDKCWSNYMGRMPQLPSSMVTVPKPDVFPSEDSDNWLPYTDSGVSTINPQPSRIRAVSLRISMLCEISNDVLLNFYDSTPGSNTSGVVEFAATTINRIQQAGKNGVQAEFKKLGELFARLEDWRKKLPSELEAKEGSLPSVLLMHMFHQTLYIHLFRPFLKSSAATNSTLSHLDPRKACLAAATMISKYLRFYKRRYGLRQICNVAGYFIHSACTIHLLNLQQKAAKRDIVQGLKSLEEIGECWLVAKRALVIVGVFVKRRGIELPEEAEGVLKRCWREGRRFGLGAQVDKVLSTAAIIKQSLEDPTPPPKSLTGTGAPDPTQATQPLPSRPHPPASPHPPHRKSFPTQSPPPPPPPPPPPIPRSSPQSFPTRFYPDQPQLAYYTSPPSSSHYLSTAAPLSPSSCASTGTPRSELLPEFGIDQGLLDQCEHWWWRDTSELANEMAVDAQAWPGANGLGATGQGSRSRTGEFDGAGTGGFDEECE